MEPISSFRGWFFCGFVIRQVVLRGSFPRIRRDAPGALAKMRPQDGGQGDDGVACALPTAFQWAFWISWAASIKRSMACPGVFCFCRPSALEREALPVKGKLEMALSAGRYESSKVFFSLLPFIEISCGSRLMASRCVCVLVRTLWFRVSSVVRTWTGTRHTKYR